MNHGGKLYRDMFMDVLQGVFCEKIKYVYILQMWSGKLHCNLPTAFT